MRLVGASFKAAIQSGKETDTGREGASTREIERRCLAKRKSKHKRERDCRRKRKSKHKRDRERDRKKEGGSNEYS
jgi:hypothetical protein